VALDPDYRDFLLLGTKVWTESGAYPTDEGVLLNVFKEVAEAAEAYSMYAGSNPRKGPATGHMVPVVQELADVVAAAFTAIIRLGFDPDDLLEWQMTKVKARYSPDVWDVKP
jgi:predicted HAD superfamily Cof-like phosphohydrolase